MSGLADWFSIFRAGQHTSSDGVTRRFSRGDLDKIIERYDGSSSPSPCVITHDEVYSPFAWAQVDALKRDGDVLLAQCKPETIEPQFAELVEGGRLYNRSVQLLPAGGGGEGWRLGHVAFLGAEPPAVNGLEPIRFAASGVTFEAEEAWEALEGKRERADIWSALRKLAEKVFGPTDADGIVKQWAVDEAREEAGRAAAEAERQEEEMATREKKETAEYAKLEAEKARLEAERGELAAKRLEFAREAAVKRVEALLEAGKLTPATAEGLAEFAVRIDAATEGVIEFSKGGEKVKTRPSEYLFSLVEASAASSPLGNEIAGGRTNGGVDIEDAGSIREAALEYQAAERNKGRMVSDTAAVQHVTGRTA